MAQWESARLEAEARLVKESKLVVPPQNQQQLGRPSISASSSAPPLAVVPTAARPQCLDVLKAWQGVVTGLFTFNTDNLQSPTSTLNFMENSLPISSSNMGFNDNFVGNSILNSGNEWKCLEKSNQVVPELKDERLTLDDHDHNNSSMGLHEMGYSSAGAWFQDSYRADHNMMEAGYSDLMVCDSGDHQQENSSSMAAVPPGENLNGTSYGGSFEENKNYWNSILNLVNSSPSGSPVF
ncbi:hypothetical protein CCACVL1_06559 [Corchorus capsularis]|uniref:Uncharacterized protein n=1 Tax=Corchorus capsularis TaxID=210143 RepID=A0A1R3JEM3_COCAP|nr:hypothetical protein CCACVL1_06559 [Corchorus capsularis]